MALNYYDNRNKVEHQLLIITLTQKDHYSNKYLFTRVVTKEYSYIGMDKATAKACALEKQEKYQYYAPIYSWESTTTPDTGETTGSFRPNRELIQGANVSAVHDGGNLYHVDISINIQDQCVVESDIEPTRETILAAFSINDFDED